jgi:hypothetical protein
MDEMPIGGEYAKGNLVFFSEYQILGLPPEQYLSKQFNHSF